MASKHGGHGLFFPDRYLSDSASGYQGTPQEVRHIVNAVHADHTFAHAKRNDPDHSHEGDEWWAFGKVAR